MIVVFKLLHRHVYAIIIIVLFAGIGTVVAYNTANPAYAGHTINEIEGLQQRLNYLEKEMVTKISKCQVCVQISDNGCGNQAGVIRCSGWVSPRTSTWESWTPWATDSNAYDPDCTRLILRCF